MVETHRIGNVVYYDYTSATMDYLTQHDGFAVARADVYSTLHPHRLTLVMIGTAAEVGNQRPAIEQTIARVRPLLERLIEEHRGLTDHLTANVTWVFNLAGQRLR